MARGIYCKSCNERMEATANKYGELYEWISGTAQRRLLCDGAHFGETEIKKGDICYAAVLLPNKNHPNYERQKPEAWAHEYIYTAF